MINLNQVLKQKHEALDKQIASAKFDRDNAATPSESHSDKTRQLAEQLMLSLMEEKGKLSFLEKTLSSFPVFNQTAQVNTIVTISHSQTENKQYLLVPDGLGGVAIDGITLLSISSPLGKQIQKQSVGYKF